MGASSHLGDRTGDAPWVAPRSVRWLPAIFRPTFEELLPRTRTDRTRRDWVFDLLAIGATIAIGLAAHQSARTTAKASPAGVKWSISRSCRSAPARCCGVGGGQSPWPSAWG